MLEEDIELASEFFVVAGIFREFVGGHAEKHAAGKAAVERQRIRGADLAYAGDMLQTVNQVRVENPLGGSRFGVGPAYPGKRHVHGDDLVDAESGIDFENFHQAAGEQAGADHEAQGD